MRLLFFILGYVITALQHAYKFTDLVGIAIVMWVLLQNDVHAEGLLASCANSLVLIYLIIIKLLN